MNKLNRPALATLAALTIGLAAAFSAQAARTDLYGDPTAVSEATRTIEITPGTKYVNVRSGEVVLFISNGQSFAFNFDNPQAQSFDLARVAPPGLLDHKVVAYVAPSPDDHG